jgi:putative sporulation protein YtaF
MHVHDWVIVITLGIASNLDNAGVGVAYGIRNIRIPVLQNFIIALISLAATLFGGFFGRWISLWLTPFMGSLVGAVVIIAVGVWVLLQPFLKTDGGSNVISRILRNPEAADLNKDKEIGIGESIILGIALAMNALVGGFDAGISKISVLATTIAVGVCSFVLLGAAEYLGRSYAAEKLGSRASMLAGVLLILIGIHQMF